MEGPIDEESLPTEPERNSTTTPRRKRATVRRKRANVPIHDCWRQSQRRLFLRRRYSISEDASDTDTDPDRMMAMQPTTSAARAPPSVPTLLENNAELTRERANRSAAEAQLLQGIHERIGFSCHKGSGASVRGIVHAKERTIIISDATRSAATGLVDLLSVPERPALLGQTNL